MKFNLDVNNLGTVYTNRQLYGFMDPNTNKPMKISISNQDKDSFEEVISKINDSGQKELSPDALMKNRKKCLITTSLSGLAGVALMVYLTRNLKPLAKTLSIISGGVVASTAGMLISLKTFLLPKTYKEVQTAKTTLKNMDIRAEK